MLILNTGWSGVLSNGSSSSGESVRAGLEFAEFPRVFVFGAFLVEAEEVKSFGEEIGVEAVFATDGWSRRETRGVGSSGVIRDGRGVSLFHGKGDDG